MDESTLSGDSELHRVAGAILALEEAPQSEGAAESESELSGNDAVRDREAQKLEGEAPAEGEEEPEAEEPKAETPAEEEEEPEETAADDEGEQEPAIASIDDLVKALDVDPSAVMGLKVKTKIDGEDGEATLADLIKSYQIEGHLTRKGQRLAEERQAFDRNRQEAEAAIKARTEQLETSLQLAQRRLMGEYGRIDWDALRAQNPSLYQQKYIEYQQLYGELSSAAQQLTAERQRAAEAAAAQHREFLAEQKRLLANAVPEWNDRKVKEGELQEIREYMKARGIDPKELDLVQHHGYALALRDAKNWQKLQNGKKVVKRKVDEAPKIVRPGVRKSSSQISSDKLKGLRDRVKQSGNVRDVAAYLLAAEG